MSFEELKALYGVPSKHFLKYLQLRSFVLARQCNSLKLPRLSTLENFSVRFSDSKGQVSFLYNLFVSKSKRVVTKHITIMEI